MLRSSDEIQEPGTIVSSSGESGMDFGAACSAVAGAFGPRGPNVNNNWPGNNNIGVLGVRRKF